MTSQECLEIFEKYLREDKHASKNTLESYMRDIRQLSDYLEASCSCSLDKASSQDIEDYIDYLHFQNKSPATVSRIVASVKCFYFHLSIRGIVKVNPSLSIKPEKVDEKLPQILTGEEIDLLLRQPKCVDAKGYRDHAMLETMYATGMRVSELLALNVNDVNLSAQLIRCADGSKERLIPMYPEAVKALEQYMHLVRGQMVLSPDENALFVNVSGSRMSRQGFWKIIKFYAKSAGIEKDITPHTLRHSFATHLLENGADKHSLKELLGYSDVSSAGFYTKLISNNLSSIYNKSHPRAATAV